MNNSELKQKTISSMVWNAIQRFGTMILSFGTNIVLARLLMPEDFGCIGMLAIFLSLSQVFIDGGFGAALIQKKKTTQEDYSTIFYWNLFVSLFFFLILQVASPFIADFYHMPKLCKLLRVLSIILLINGFTVVQTNILTKKLSFKMIAKIRLIAISMAMIVSIGAAYLGMGVWSLVIKDLLAATLGAAMFWGLNKWRPSFVFSRKSFKELFSFGGLMLLSSLLNTFFENLQGLVIGRCYTAKDLGYYSQAKRLDEIPSHSLSQIVTQVSFPVFSQIADNKDLLIHAVKKNVITTTYIIFPLQAFLIAVAYPLIIFVFSEKWLEAIPYFRILCIYSMFVSLNAINTNIYKALGKSNYYFWVQLIKKMISVGLLFIGLNHGVLGVTWSVSISGVIWWIFSASINTKLIGYGIIQQIRDIYMQFLLAIVLGTVVSCVLDYLNVLPVFQLIAALLIFLPIYVCFSKILKLEGYKTISNEVVNKYFKNKIINKKSFQ